MNGNRIVFMNDGLQVSEKRLNKVPKVGENVTLKSKEYRITAVKPLSKGEYEVEVVAA